MTPSENISTIKCPGKKRRVIINIFSTLFPALIIIAVIIGIAVKLNRQVAEQMLERYQQEQLVSVIQQSARLGDTLKNITGDLEMLSTHEELINYREIEARKSLQKFYEKHRSFVVAGYRMDKNGVLTYVEGKDEKGEGFNISEQAHVKQLFKTQSTIISGSFKAVEGYYAIAVHVPVFKDGILDGSLATLVMWDGFKDWFTNARTGSESFTMLLDKEHKIIFHPQPEYIGKTLEQAPDIIMDKTVLPTPFLYKKNTGVLSGPFFNQREYVVACHPFMFEGVAYSLVNCAPYDEILEPIYQTSLLTALLVGFSLLIISVSMAYFLSGYQRDKKNWLKYQKEVKRETEERELAEQTLSDTQNAFLTVLNSIDATIHVADMEDHTILFMNQSMADSFKVSEWEGKKCYKVFRDKNDPCDFCTNPKLLDENGQPTGVHIWEDQNPVTQKWYQNFDQAIKWIDGRMVRIQIATDITSIKVYEAQQQDMAEKLQRAQKMEAIGTLAGGVAHDLNNVLSGIVTYPELLLLDLPEDSPMVKPLNAIHNSGLKASEIVSDLLTLGRRGVTTSEIVDLNEIITEYTNSPEYAKLKSYHPNIKIKTHTDPKLLNIKGSPIHLRKTVMNLVSNAVEAHLSQEGLVEIHTRNRYLNAPLKGYNNMDEGEYVLLKVTDQGTGIAQKDLNRIFEPFYTKKVMGRSGTGLGMAVVWGTVQDHNGYICLDSEEGIGTTISIYFPVSFETSKKGLLNQPLETYKGEKENVLIVDDVAEQRTIAASILEKLNYKVTTVKSGEKAIDYLKTNSYDLILLDMIMDPGMDGLDTYKEALQYNPKQKAILASGFSETQRVKEAQELGAGAYIKKPYRMEDLGRAVKNELERA